MSSYARVAHGIWGDERFRGLSSIKPSGQSLWLFLVTGPHNRGVPGLFLTSRSQIAERLKWSARDVERCFAEIEKAGMAVADWANGVVWLPRGVRHDRPGNPNVVAGWWRQLSPMPECELVVRAIRGLRDWCILEGKGWVEAFDKGLSKAFHEGFREGVLKDCNARVPSPSPSPSPLGSREPLKEGGEPQSDSGKSSADPQDPVFAAWNAGRARRGLPPIPDPADLAEARAVLALAAPGDDAAQADLAAAYLGLDGDDWLRERGWGPKFLRNRIDGLLSDRNARLRRKAPVPREDAVVLPTVLGATLDELRPYARPASDPFTAEEEEAIAAELAARRPVAAGAPTPRWRPPVEPVERDTPHSAGAAS